MSTDAAEKKPRKRRVRSVEEPSRPSESSRLSRSPESEPRLNLPKPLWRILSGVAPALSLRQPWAWAVLHLSKTIENRLTWKSCHYRGPVLIHASSEMTATYYQDAVDLMVSRKLARVADDLEADPSLPLIPARDDLDLLPRGGIVGVSRVDGVVVPATISRSGSVFYGASGIRSLTDAEARWWMGGFGLLLSKTVPFMRDGRQIVVPARGAPRFFTPPAWVYREVVAAAIASMYDRGTGAPIEQCLLDRTLTTLRPWPGWREAQASLYLSTIGDLAYVCDAIGACGCSIGQLRVAHDECRCVPEVVTRLRTRCRSCKASMRAINLRTGWPVEET